jgi:hypothetical protein
MLQRQLQYWRGSRMDFMITKFETCQSRLFTLIYNRYEALGRALAGAVPFRLGFLCRQGGII